MSLSTPDVMPVTTPSARETSFSKSSSTTTGEVVAFNPGTLADPRANVERTMAAFRRAVRGQPLLAYEQARVALDEMRVAAAAAFGGDPAGWALADGATATVDRLANVLFTLFGRSGTPLTIVTTDSEHIGGVGAFAADPRFDVIEVPVDRIVDTPGSLYFVSHFAYDTNRDHGAAIRRLVERDDRPVVLVDGTQAIGQVDVDVGVLGCHAYFSSAHKWLGGPQGSGLLYLREDVRTTWPTPFHAGEPLCKSGPIGRWEPRGGQDFSRIAGITAAIEDLLRGPYLAIHLRDRFAESLRERLGSRVHVLDQSSEDGRVVVFALPALDVYDVYRALGSRGVVVKCIKKSKVPDPPWRTNGRADALIGEIVDGLEGRRS